MKPSCVISCPIDTFSGYGARSRDFVKALIKAKGEEWDIYIMPQKWGDCPWGYLPENDPLKNRYRTAAQMNNKRPDIWIQITIPNEFQPVGHLNIGVTAGIESTIYPPDFMEGFNRMSFNLISSNHSKNVAQQCTYEKRDKNTNKLQGTLKLEKPVEVLFEGLDLDKYFKKPEKSGFLDDIKEDFCFLYTGHWLPGKLGEDRKNTGLMIKTFLETFNTPSNKKPALILKTNIITYSILDREEIIKKINKIRSKVKGNLPNIYILHGELTDEEMNQLNNDPKIKAFVSFTKGEGFGRPLLEGAITGKPTIVSNWSGQTDFLKPDYNILIGGELKPIHKSAANKWLLKDSQWFNINTDIASKAMKDVFKDYKKYIVNSRKQTQYIKDNWTFNAMTEKLKDILSNIKIEVAPQQVGLNLPKLKKVESKEDKPATIKLPKLKKVT